MTSPPVLPGPEFLPFQTALAGRYSIEYELGRGGMGIVFLAREVALDRMVALKLLPPELAARPRVKERFLKEARTAAGLSHPNVVPIHAVDEVEGYVFFAMAYVDGGTLGDRLRDRGPLSNSEAVRLLREVSWALAYAHVQGVVHRDVKPDNILLEKGTGRALVTDFGIAVAADDSPTDSVPQGEEAVDQVAGTAEFMSPEQAVGAPVDGRSDLYSLGCVGFYALTGKMPFSGPTPSAILTKHVAEPAPPLTSAVDHVPPTLATAIDRCLRKDPSQRFQGGEALANALQPQLETDHEVAVPLRVFVKQSRGIETTFAFGALVLLFAGPGLLAGLGGALDTGNLIALALIVALSIGVPLLAPIQVARRLLEAGYTQPDATVAFLRDVQRKEEEFRFEVGKRSSLLDRAGRLVKVLGLGTAAGAFTVGAVGAIAGWMPAMTAAGWFSLAGMALPVGLAGTLFGEIRARLRFDTMGERLLSFWSGKAGRAVFKVAGFRLKRVAPAIEGVHRPTEVVIGLAADRLFAELAKDDQKRLADLPETVRALEEDARAMRRQVGEMDAVLAELGDDDPSRPSADERALVRQRVQRTRDEAQGKLQEAVAALETIRLGLLYMHAGSGTVESVTMELESARGISEAMDQLVAGHREVARILDERRRTGFFTLTPPVTADG